MIWVLNWNALQRFDVLHSLGCHSHNVVMNLLDLRFLTA